MHPDSHFDKYSDPQEYAYNNNNNYSNQSYYYNPKTNNYYKNTKTTFTFVDPKTGKAHKININKSEKTNIYDNQFFYQNEEFMRKMRERENRQNTQNTQTNSNHRNNNNNDNNDGSNSNSSQNPYYEDLQAEGNGYRYRKREYHSPDGSSSSYFHSKTTNDQDSFVVEFSFKHYLTFVFIFVTFISFAIFIKRNPPNGDPFMYKNSVYYPKNQDPILRDLIKTNKIDAYQLDKMNYAGKRYYD